MGDGGAFGKWTEDSGGLPRFDVEPRSITAPGLVLPEKDPGRIWHQVGNDRLTATAHAGGWTVLYSTGAGTVRLNGTDPAKPEGLGGLWTVEDEAGGEVLSALAPGLELHARWGTGYAEWRASRDGVEVLRRVWAPRGGVPALRVDVSVDVDECNTPGARYYTERWGFRPYPLLPGALMSKRVPAPGTYSLAGKLAWQAMFTGSSACRFLTEALRGFYGSRMALAARFEPALRAVLFEPARGGPPADGTRRRIVPCVPGVVFLAALEPCAPSVARFAPLCPPAGRGNPAVAEISVPLEVVPGTTRFSFAVGVAPAGDIPAVLEAAERADEKAEARYWKSGISLTAPNSPALEREAAWHAYYLRSATVEDSILSCRFVPQGSAYGFIQGMHGAVLDYAFTCVPLAYIDPPLAKEMLKLSMMLTYPDGGMAYAHNGCGYATGALVHGEPTDLPLFLLWALTEYVWATGDYPFLEESVPFIPRRWAAASSSTVLDRVILAWRRSCRIVGTGDHGMLLAGSGDWCDPIALMAPRSRAFHRRGESAFNTAMAAYVLPRAAELVSARCPLEAEAMRRDSAALRGAMESAWRGRWFLRGWDGVGGPIGADHLFLDAQAWCLIAGIGTAAQRGALVDAIKESCDDPSPIGATILDRPHPVRMGVLAPGWDCNGGVWSAINGLLAWAYSLHDPELAWRSLEKQTLSAHARAYPRVWFGVWSGPDAYNAHYAERPGETFVQPATPMAEFPVMNSNAHAGPLLALLRTLGVEAGPEGISVTPRVSPEAGSWSLSTPLFHAEGRNGNVAVELKEAP